MKEEKKKMTLEPSKDFFGNLLGKIPLDIDISSIEMWMVRILLWVFFVKFMVELFG